MTNDPSLCWVHSHFVGFVMRWLILFSRNFEDNSSEGEGEASGYQTGWEKVYNATAF